MVIEYVEVDANNLASWHQSLFEFARDLDITQRCNAAAVTAGRMLLTYPSFSAIQEYVNRGDLIVIAHEGNNIKGYLVCREDTKLGGGQAKWIGCVFIAPPQNMVDVYSTMSDFAVARYGWMWGRVTHPGIHNLLLVNVPECEEDQDDPDILTYKRP